MKKRLYLLILLMIIIIPLNVNAKEVKVKFSKCVDGDTANFIMDDKVIKVRFLAIDTPETVHPTKGVQAYGKNASEYTCTKITNAKSIVLEFDDNSDEKDKYDRYLAWVFVDKSLLQEELVSSGYAKVAYLYGDYKYTSKLEKVQKTAQDNKVGMWADYKPEPDYTVYIVIIGIIVIIIIAIVSKKSRTKIKNEIEKESKKQFKKALNNLIK